MTNLTEQEIVDAIDRALERVGRQFAESRPKSKPPKASVPASPKSDRQQTAPMRAKRG